MKEHLKISTTLSIIVYLLTSFVKWDILWASEIPSYTIIDRVIMVGGYIILHLISVLIGLVAENNKKIVAD